jgi:hypothetical protein
MTAANFASRRADTLQTGDLIHVGTCTHVVTRVAHASATEVTVTAGPTSSWLMPASQLINTERTPT